MPTLHFDPHPQADDIAILSKGLMAYAHEQRGLPPIQCFAFYFRDEQNTILGGLNGACLYGCLYIDQLWMSEHFRKTGYGTQLMKKAHEHGKDQGCTFAAVNTMDWEALGFYQKLGYELEFTRKGFMKDAKFYFLRKNL
ncbi:MAG: GNAT family N-acetyltransferase [Candidatus Berkiella sp.]